MIHKSASHLREVKQEGCCRRAATITTTVWPLAVWLGWSTTQRRCWPLFIQLCSSTSTKELAALGMHVVLAAALVLVAWTQLNLFARIS